MSKVNIPALFYSFSVREGKGMNLLYTILS